jgi:hypothetical protein
MMNLFFIVQEVILNFSDDIMPEPNKSLHDSGGWSLVEKILWYGKILFCLQSLAVILPTAGELYL